MRGLPQAQIEALKEHAQDALAVPDSLPDLPFADLVKQHGRRLNAKYRGWLNGHKPDKDRSRAMHELGHVLREQGVPRDHAVVLLHHVTWNKYAGRADEVEQLYHCVDKDFTPQLSVVQDDGPWGENLYELMGRDIPEPEYGIENIMPLRGFGMIGGEAKTHKTWWAIDLAVAVSTGTPFLGEYHVRDTGPVMFVEAEVRKHS